MAEKITKTSMARICEKYGFEWDAGKSKVTILGVTYSVVFKENGRLPQGQSKWKIAAKSNPKFASDYSTTGASNVFGKRALAKLTLGQLKAGLVEVDKEIARVELLAKNTAKIQKANTQIALLEGLAQGLEKAGLPIPEELTKQLADTKETLAGLTNRTK
jgi:hypothetical protein